MTLLAKAVQAGEVTVYVLLTVVGVAAAVVGSGYGLTVQGGEVGPGMVPTVSGAILAVLCGIQAVRSARARRSETEPEIDPDEKDIFGRTNAERVRHLWTVFLLLWLTILAVTYIGFLGGFGAFVFVVSAWVEKRGILPSLLISVLSCTFIHLVFVTFLQIPLPLGNLIE